MATDVASTLELIDGALADWDTGPDAMRWTPQWDEPIVRDPSTPRERLIAQGWDGHAALAHDVFVLGHLAVKFDQWLRGAVDRLQVFYLDFGRRLEHVAADLGRSWPSVSFVIYDEIRRPTPIRPVPVKPSRRTVGWRRG